MEGPVPCKLTPSLPVGCPYSGISTKNYPTLSLVPYCPLNCGAMPRKIFYIFNIAKLADFRKFVKKIPLARTAEGDIVVVYKRGANQSKSGLPDIRSFPQGHGVVNLFSIKACIIRARMYAESALSL